MINLLTVRLTKELEKRLEKLAKITKRSKSFLVKEALEHQLEDVEDFYIASERLSSPGATYTTKELKKRLGL